MRTEEFNHIILPMRSNLKAYALRLTESDDNAEDLVQEVMLRLWDIRQNIKAEDNLKVEGTKRSVYLKESPKMMEEPRIEIVR